MNIHRIICYTTLLITTQTTTCMEKQPKTCCRIIVHNLPENSHCAVSQKNNSIVLAAGCQLQYIDLDNQSKQIILTDTESIISSIKTRDKNFAVIATHNQELSYQNASLWIFMQCDHKQPKIIHKNLSLRCRSHYSIDFYPHKQDALIISDELRWNADIWVQTMNAFFLDDSRTEKIYLLSEKPSYHLNQIICHPYKSEIIHHKSYTNLSQVYSFVDPRTNRYAKLLLSAQKIGGIFDLLPQEIKNTILALYVQTHQAKPKTSLIKKIYRKDCDAITSIGYSPDGKQLLTLFHKDNCGRDQFILQNNSSDKIVSQSAASFAFHPNLPIACIIDDTMILEYIDINTLATIAIQQLEDGHSLSKGAHTISKSEPTRGVVHFSADGKLVYIVTSNALISIDVPTEVVTYEV